MTDVPRGTILYPNGRATVFLPDGEQACTRCLRRPRAPGQRYCQVCRTEYNHQRRMGKIEMLLTADERDLILRLRAGSNARGTRR